MSAVVVTQAVGPLGTTELLIILGVLILLFGAKKLPELARGSGRALRIFKSETKGLMDEDDEQDKTPEQKQIDAQTHPAAPQPEATPEQHRTDTDR